MERIFFTSFCPFIFTLNKIALIIKLGVEYQLQSHELHRISSMMKFIPAFKTQVKSPLGWNSPRVERVTTYKMFVIDGDNFTPGWTSFQRKFLRLTGNYKRYLSGNDHKKTYTFYVHTVSPFNSRFSFLLIFISWLLNVITRKYMMIIRNTS